MKIHPMVSRLASGSVYLFAVGVAIYAVLAPYMKLKADDLELEEYLDKTCANGVCGKSNEVRQNNATALYALYISFIILAGISFILLLLDKRKLYNWIGFLLLAVALGTLITLIVIIKTSYIEFEIIITKYDYYYDMTSASILMIIACCFMIVKQIFSNDIIRSTLKKLF